jgi:hypothetical protein
MSSTSNSFMRKIFSRLVKAVAVQHPHSGCVLLAFLAFAACTRVADCRVCMQQQLANSSRILLPLCKSMSPGRVFRSC